MNAAERLRAERLLAFVEDTLQPQFKSNVGFRDWQKAARHFFNEALADARRAGAAAERERIAAMLEEHGADPGLVAAVRHVLSIEEQSASAKPTADR